MEETAFFETTKAPTVGPSPDLTESEGHRSSFFSLELSKTCILLTY